MLGAQDGIELLLVDCVGVAVAHEDEACLPALPGLRLVEVQPVCRHSVLEDARVPALGPKRHDGLLAAEVPLHPLVMVGNSGAPCARLAENQRSQEVVRAVKAAVASAACRACGGGRALAVVDDMVPIVTHGRLVAGLLRGRLSVMSESSRVVVGSFAP